MLAVAPDPSSHRKNNGFLIGEGAEVDGESTAVLDVSLSLFYQSGGLLVRRIYSDYRHSSRGGEGVWISLCDFVK